MLWIILIIVGIWLYNWATTESKINQYQQEINRLNEQYDNLVHEYNQAKIDEANKMLY